MISHQWRLLVVTALIWKRSERWRRSDIWCFIAALLPMIWQHLPTMSNSFFNGLSLTWHFSYFKDGEIDLKLLTRGLSSEADVVEVRKICFKMQKENAFHSSSFEVIMAKGVETENPHECFSVLLFPVLDLCINHNISFLVKVLSRII